MTINAEPIDKAKVDIELLHGDNALTLLRELDWLGQVIELRIKLYFQQGCELTSIDQLPSPELQLDDSLVATWLKQQQLGFNERLVLILALAPHIKPQALDTFLFVTATLIRRTPSLVDGTALPTEDFCPPRKQRCLFWLVKILRCV